MLVIDCVCKLITETNAGPNGSIYTVVTTKHITSNSKNSISIRANKTATIDCYTTPKTVGWASKSLHNGCKSSVILFQILTNLSAIKGHPELSRGSPWLNMTGNFGQSIIGFAAL